MKINSKGFTLIELVVSIAIITIASSMFILGFVNVTNIMGESALIKNDTNELYNNLIADKSVQTSNNQLINLKVNGVSKQIGVENKFIEKNASDVIIKLSHFIPTLNADLLPNNPVDVEEVDPEKCLTAEFKVLTNICDLPESYDELLKMINYGSSWQYVESIGTCTKSINPKVVASTFGNQVGRYIINEPTSETLKKYVNNRNGLELSYLDWLISDDYYVKWFCIDKPKDISKPYVVYGYLLKKDSRDLVINFNDGIKNRSFFYSLFDDVLDGKILNIPSHDAAYLRDKKFEINDDERIYSYTDIVNMKFVKDNSKSIYIAKVVK